MENQKLYYKNAEAEVMYTHEEIQVKVREVAAEIDAYYAEQGIEKILVIGVLKGAFVFLADLVRNMETHISMDFIQVKSYAGTESTGNVRFIQDVTIDVEGKHVLFVEDIVDTGFTLCEVFRIFEGRKPASIKLASMLDKPSRRTVDFKADFVGFSIPDKFVVGYGLDYDEYFRELPYIGNLIIHD